MGRLFLAIKDRYEVKNMTRRGQHELGATAIEYGLIAAGISVAIIALVQWAGGPKKKTGMITPPAITQSYAQT